MIPERPASEGASRQRPPAEPVASGPATGPVCVTCGTVATTAMPLTWSASTEAGRRVWICDRCARENVRSIEAKLDSAWW